LDPADCKGGDTYPSALITAGWRRWIARAMRGAPDAVSVHATLSPYGHTLEEEGNRPDEWSAWAQNHALDRVEVRESDHQRLVVILDSSMCNVVSLGAVERHWGPQAVRVVTLALREGLGRVINVWTPCDLEWLMEHWIECVDYEDPEDKVFTRNRIREFRTAQRTVVRASRPFKRRRDLLRALQTLPAGPVRQSAAGLLSTSRRPPVVWRSAAMHRLKYHGDPSACVLLTTAGHDAVHSAYDELQESRANAGEYQPPHGVLLLDTRTPARMSASIRKLHRLLRTIRWAECLLDAVNALYDAT